MASWLMLTAVLSPMDAHKCVLRLECASPLDGCPVQVKLRKRRHLYCGRFGRYCAVGTPHYFPSRAG